MHTHVVESTVRPRLNPTEQAMLRSQGGPLSGVPFQCFPSNVVSRFDSPSSAFCSSAVFGLPFPPLHAAVGVAVPSTSLATTGQLVLKQWCWVVEGMHWNWQPRGFAVRQGRVGTNIMVRDMDLLPQDHQDGRRLEVVADGLPLFHGAQLALDTSWCHL